MCEVLNEPLGSLSMQRFLATDRHWKCTVFLFYLSSHYHIYIIKFLCASRDDSFENMGETKCTGLQNVHFRLLFVAQKRCMPKLPIMNVCSSCRILVNFLLYCSYFSNNCGNALLWCKVYNHTVSLGVFHVPSYTLLIAF